VIRNMVLVELKPASDLQEVAAIQDGLLALNCPGTLRYMIGTDLGLRPGNWSFALVADFTDADAYRAYDANEEHNRLRDRMAPFSQNVARIQIEIDGERDEQ
jgi:hypothetical protein